MMELTAARKTDFVSPRSNRAFALAIAVAAALAAPAAAAATSPPISALAVASGSNIERQHTVVNKSEHMAQASAAATSGGPGSGGQAAFGLGELKSLVPERIGAWQRRALIPVTPGRLEVGGRTVNAKFGLGKKEATLSVGDLGAAGNVGGQAQWSGAAVARATETGSEKIYGEGSYTVREDFTRDPKLNRVTLILRNGIVIGASGTAVDMAELKQLASGVDLARAQALVRPAK